MRDWLSKQYLDRVLASPPGSTTRCPWGPRIGPHQRDCLCRGAARLTRDFLICALDLRLGTWP